jgi:3-(3-hydroxy-phenyl)propionate hydroxylase
MEYAAMSMRSADLPVLVAGAGPVGLTAALALRARGLPVTVLEAGPDGRTRPGSRAIFYHRQTLEHWEAMKPGLGRQVAQKGLVWSTKRTFWGERQVFERSYQPTPPAQLPHSVNLAQVDAERLLFEACVDADVNFVWNAEVTGVESTPQCVTVGTAAGGTWRAQFLIAADGAGSGVRQALEIELEGSRSANSFVIVDVIEETERPHRPERLYYYRHPAVGERNVLLMPFAGGWRADLQLRTEDDPADFNQPEGVARWVARVLPEKYAERVSWISTYQFLQVIASTFTDSQHRVLLVGEAAHLFAPFGARGLNSGVPDAAAAAAAIAAAIRAGDRPGAAAAVQEFAAQRRSAALYNRDAAGVALTHMRAYSPLAKVKRRAAAAAAIAGQRAGQWLDSAPYGPRAAARGTKAVY